MNLRRHGTWTRTCNNAQCLTALAEYSQLQPTPYNFVDTVKLAAKKLGNTRFNGYQNPSLQVNIPMDNLPRCRHDLLL